MKNQNLKEKQKLESIARLEILQNEYLLHKNVLKEFTKEGTIYYSENLGGVMSGILYWLHNKSGYVEVVEEVQQEHNIFVYHCLLKHMELGDILIMLYVSEDEEDWKSERQELLEGYINVCAYNLGLGYYEFGQVEITGVNGGICTLY